MHVATICCDIGLKNDQATIVCLEGVHLMEEESLCCEHSYTAQIWQNRLKAQETHSKMDHSNLFFFFFWWLLYMYYSLYSQTYTPSRNSSFVNRLKLRTPSCVSFTWQWATHESSYFCFLCLEPLGLLRSETPLYKLPDRKTVLPSSCYHNPRPTCSNDWVVILTHLRVFGARMSFLRRAGFSEDAPQKKRRVCMHTCMNACVHFK